MAHFTFIRAKLFVIIPIIFPFIIAVTFAEDFHNRFEAQRHNAAGMEFLSKKDYAGAYTSFQKAIQLHPSIKFYHNNLAVACMNLKKYEEALTHLSKAIEIDPLYVKALSNKAICHFYLHQYHLALLYYRKALVADSSYTEKRFPHAKIIQEMESIQKSRPDDATLREIIDRMKHP